MNNLEEIRDEVIRRGFPELMTENISIKYTQLKDAFLYCNDFPKNGHHIKVDEELGNSPREVLIGGVAHEFAHLVDAEKRNTKGKVVDYILYNYLRTYRIAVERDTDLQAIMRGFGTELLAFLKYTEKLEPHDEEHGLSAREVEAILLAKR